MKDKLKESISALLDDQADELEMRKILAQSHDQEVTETWRRFHQMKAAMRPEEAAWAGVDLTKGINAALDSAALDDAALDSDVLDEIDPANSAFDNAERSEDSQSETEIKTASNKVTLLASRKQTTSGVQTHWWKGLAVAASVAFLAVLTVQFGSVQPDSQPTQQLVEHAPAVETLQDVELLANQEDAIEFSAEHEERLAEYLMRHSGHAAFNSGKSAIPFARLTSFEAESE